jgi:hypothetical protein
MQLASAALAGVGFSQTINLGAVLLALLIVTLAGVFTLRANLAKTWQHNYEAERVRAEQAEAEAREQRELKHDLKSELAAAKMKTDQTPLFAGITQILERLSNAESSGVETVSKLLEAMDERAVARDAALLATQREIAATLDRISDRMADRVSEVIREELNPDTGGQ